MAVFVLDRHKKPLMPCREKRARKLLKSGRARVHRLMPFTIRLVDRCVDASALQPIKLKLDPGSKTTGMALVREVETVDNDTGEIHMRAHVLNLFELHHRGRQISESLTARRQMRRRRRGNLRYRAPRFLNRGNQGKGWIAPSLQHRVETIRAWVTRFQRLTPLAGIAQELVRFDLQQMENPEISGIQYQQGTLARYETREYLLNKWGRECAYCGAKNTLLQIEHLQPKAQGGNDRISNLTLACPPCNQKKGSQALQVFLEKDPKRLARILAQAKAPLKDAAAVNTTRWALFNALNATGLPVTTGSGGLTKFNRLNLGIPKTHALDAACVGHIDVLCGWHQPTLEIKATGRGSCQRTRLDAYGFSRGYLTRQKRIHGFQTGDRVKAEVTKGKKIGLYLRRVAVRASGSFNIQTAQGIIQGISHRFCQVVQRADGYGYAQRGKFAKDAELRSARSTSPP
jgi:5-methylcytosine-specific restriction endonuclease McrA